MHLRVGYTMGGLYVLAMVFLIASSKEDPPQRNVRDAFKVLEWYPMAFAIFDQDLDGDLDCLYAVRTAMDLDARTATYVFKFGGRNGKDKQSFILHAKPGPAPETVLVTEGNGDEEENIATVAYAEYKTCSVWQVPIMNRPECILWTPPETLNAIPQTCMDQFREICELGVPVYDESCDYIK